MFFTWSTCTALWLRIASLLLLEVIILLGKLLLVVHSAGSPRYQEQETCHRHPLSPLTQAGDKCHQTGPKGWQSGGCRAAICPQQSLAAARWQPSPRRDKPLSPTSLAFQPPQPSKYHLPCKVVLETRRKTIPPLAISKGTAIEDYFVS